MIEQTIQKDIPRPASQTYDFVITNYVANHPSWDARTISTELTSTDGLKVGATGVEVRKEMGRRNTFNFTVTELTGDRLVFDARGGRTTFGATWSVTPNGANASRLSMTFRLSLGGIVRIFEPLARGGIRKDMEASAERIKEMLEAT